MKHVVIIGVGFGGLFAARVLANKSSVRVTLIDRNNYHIFQPLLYQVATASIEQEAIAYPVRSIAAGWKNARFLLAEVEGIDLANRVVKTSEGPVDYDYLIVAAGAETSFLGLNSVEKHAFQLKTLADAVAIRNQVLTVFERAARETDPRKRAALLTFAVVGGGPTGVEFCGAMAELVRQVMRKDFPEIRPEEVKIILLEASENVLPMVPPRLRGYAIKRLGSMHVEVRLDAKVTNAEPDRVFLSDGSTIEAATLLWAAGVKAVPLADSLKTAQGHAGRIIVQPDLTLPDHREIFVVGDMAHIEDDGAPLPNVAQVAMQTGAYASREILRRERGDTKPAQPFKYFDLGVMAVIGRGAAVATIFGVSFTGIIAWFVWLGLHLFQLIGFRNRLVVLLNWAYDYLFFDRKVRLITWTRRQT